MHAYEKFCRLLLSTRGRPSLQWRLLPGAYERLNDFTMWAKHGRDSLDSQPCKQLKTTKPVTVDRTILALIYIIALSGQKIVLGLGLGLGLPQCLKALVSTARPNVSTRPIPRFRAWTDAASPASDQHQQLNALPHCSVRPCSALPTNNLVLETANVSPGGWEQGRSQRWTYRTLGG